MSVYALALWTSASSPLPSIHSQEDPAVPAFLPAFGERRQVVPATITWDYQRGFVESYPTSRRVVVILSLPRSPCSARRSDTFLSLGPWTRPDPRQLCKTPCGGKQSPIRRKSFRSDGVLLRRWQGSVVWAQPRILASTPRRRIQQFPLLHPRSASLGCAQQACHPSRVSLLCLLYV